MRAILKAGMVVLVPENDAEREHYAEWCETAKGHVFHFPGGSSAFHDLGPREAACREPINIVFDQTEACWQPISNLALTPFMLRGKHYASIEGFWQGLKFSKDADRARIARLFGKAAKRAAEAMPQPELFHYDGASYAAGGAGHRSLMLEACAAKFEQNAEAQAALLATGERPLLHRPRRDSKTIPGALMADIWMQLRAKYR